MTAVRRMTMKLSGIAFGVAFSLVLAGPALAQDAPPPVDVTAAPPPSPDTIGPSQLRDFSLGGKVTRPADRPAATTVQPQPRATQPDVSAPAPATPSSDAAGANTRRATSSLPSARDLSPSGPASETTAFRPSSETVTPAPSSVETGSVPPPSFGDDAASQTTALPNGRISRSWIAALLALIVGGAFLAWNWRNRRQRYGDPGRLAFAGLVPEVDSEPALPPPFRPRPDPAPPRAHSAPPVRPTPEPKPKAPDSGLVVSTRLKPQLAIQFQPDRAVITDNEVMLQFDMVVTNSGSAVARDVLIEACMVSAHAGQDEEIARFFQQPIGKGDRIPAIPPLANISLKSAVRLPLAQIHSFEMEGRTLFVPLVAFNILYSGDAQTSASFLVGRGTDEDEKLAPFRLDLGPRIFRGLSSRPHSGGIARS
jgi:hypothetical protein